MENVLTDVGSPFNSFVAMAQTLPDNESVFYRIKMIRGTFNLELHTDQHFISFIFTNAATVFFFSS
jgi:hypothetical protein